MVRPPTDKRRTLPPAPPSGPSWLSSAPAKPRTDLVLDYVAFVGKALPLSVLLDDAPRRIGEIVQADVVSIYLLEGEPGELVLRGNIGFPEDARGSVRLALGEGLTGQAVSTHSPVCTSCATEVAGYREFPELEEERFPVFLAVPILGPRGPLGALVAQRARADRFTQSEVELAIALTAPIASCVRHAQLTGEGPHPRRTGGGTRRAVLPGRPVVSGRVLGGIATLRRPSNLPMRGCSPDDRRLVGEAFVEVERALRAMQHRARQLGLGPSTRFLEHYLLMVSDARIRERASELLREERSPAEAFGLIAREAVRAANGDKPQPFLQQRAEDIEDLCDALVMLSSPDPRAKLPLKALLIGDRLTVFDLLVSARAQLVGVALSDQPAEGRATTLLRLLGVPAIVDVHGLYRWTEPGDVALLDADHGFLTVNPSRAEIGTVRAARRKHGAQGHEGAPPALGE